MNDLPGRTPTVWEFQQPGRGVVNFAHEIRCTPWRVLE